MIKKQANNHHVLSALEALSLEQTILKGKGYMTSQPIEDTVFGTLDTQT